MNTVRDLPPPAGEPRRKLLLVVGCPRCGTTWVQLLLAQHGLDERSRPQDAFVGRPPLAAPAQGGEAGPPPGAPAQAPALEVGAAALPHPLGHEGPVPLAGGAPGLREPAQHFVPRLPWLLPAPEESTMAGPGILVQRREIPDQAGSQGVQVDVPGEATAGRIPHSRKLPSITRSIRSAV